jgi:hypothetical protein
MDCVGKSLQLHIHLAHGPWPELYARGLSSTMHFLSAVLSMRKLRPGVTQSHQVSDSSPMPQTQRQTLNSIPIELQDRIVVAVRSLFHSLTSLYEHLFQIVHARP